MDDELKIKTRNRKFKDRTGEVFGDYLITGTVSTIRGMKYLTQCQKCGYKRSLYQSNYCNNEGKKCFKCLYYDVIGKQIGQLYIISKIENGKNGFKKTFYNARCMCGKEIIISRNTVANGKNPSCGCRGLSTEDIVMNNLIVHCAINAKRRGYDFSLTDEQFKKVSKENCYYCNAPPRLINLTRSKVGPLRMKDKVYASGLDRVDNSKGYLEDNVVACCITCNVKKHGVTVDIAMKILKFLKIIE